MSPFLYFWASLMLLAKQIGQTTHSRPLELSFDLPLSFPEPGPTFDSDLREAVAYCYLLHRIVTKYVEEPVGPTTFTEKLFDHCEGILRGEGYKA